MTFIKLHYLLEHELLVLSPQGDMHMESPEHFCSAVTGCNSRDLLTAGTENVPSPVELWVSCSVHGLTTGSQSTGWEKQNPLQLGKALNQLCPLLDRVLPSSPCGGCHVF